MNRHGRTFAEELGIKLDRPGPSALYRLLCASTLLSARIRASVATKAARALFDKGWTSAEKVTQSSWEERTKTLNEAGYARYDERTSTMLGESAQLLVDRYRGDLRRLRDEAEGDPKKERQLLKEFKGIGDVGVDIFFREVQLAWDELFPFADRRALAASKRLGLGGDARELLEVVGQKDFPRLVAALVRVGIERDFEAVLKEADHDVT